MFIVLDDVSLKYEIICIVKKMNEKFFFMESGKQADDIGVSVLRAFMDDVSATPEELLFKWFQFSIFRLTFYTYFYIHISHSNFNLNYLH